MLGIRFRDLQGGSHELAISGGKFVEPADGVAEWIDLRHGSALHGLVDAHAHLTGGDVATLLDDTDDPGAAIASHAREQLLGGVLLVADKGGRDNAGLGVLDLETDQRPEMRLAGAIARTEGGYYPDYGLVVDAEAPVADWIEAIIDPRASWVKLVGDWPRRGVGPVSNFTESQLRMIVEAAHARGKRVAIHAAAPGTPSMAVAAGVDSIEHGLFLTPEDLEILGSRGGAWVPTIAAMEGIRDMLGPGSSGGRLFEEGLANARELLPTAAACGVNVLAGTDLHLAHGHVAMEAQRLVEYGLNAEAALAALTYTGYAYFGDSRRFEVGAIADLVVVKGDPRDDISHVADPLFVMRAGRVVRQ